MLPLPCRALVMRSICSPVLLPVTSPLRTHVLRHERLASQNTNKTKLMCRVGKSSPPSAGSHAQEHCTAARLSWEIILEQCATEMAALKHKFRRLCETRQQCGGGIEHRAATEIAAGVAVEHCLAFGAAAEQANQPAAFLELIEQRR